MPSTTASAWTPVASMSRPRWWTAVLTGALAPVLVTPLADVLPPLVRLGVLAALVFVAMVTGLWGYARRAVVDPATPGARPGGAMLPGLAALVAVGGGAALTYWTGDERLLAVVGFAIAVHLVAGSILRSLLARVPGADPVSTASAPDPRSWTGQVLRAVPWLPAVVIVVAVVAAGAHVLLDPLRPPWSGIGHGLGAAVSTLLVAAPVSFVIARVVPVSAARERGRELGVWFGAVDLDRLGRAHSLLLDPIGVVTDSRPRLVGVRTMGRLQATAALQAAASVAAGSQVPEHRTLVQAAAGRAIELRPAEIVHEDRLTRVARIKGTEVTIGPASAFDRVPLTLMEEDTTLYTGWGGSARAGLSFVPSVRSEALEAWPTLRGLGVRPSFCSPDPVALRHLGAAMEMPEADLHSGDAARLARDLTEGGPTVVLAHGATRDLPWGDDLFAIEPGGPGPLGDGADPHTVRATTADLGSAGDVLGLTRKMRRVRAQSTVISVVLTLAGVVSAALGLLDPFLAAIVGAGTPLVVAANSLRPRSFGR